MPDFGDCLDVFDRDRLPFVATDARRVDREGPVLLARFQVDEPSLRAPLAGRVAPAPEGGRRPLDGGLGLRHDRRDDFWDD